MRRTISNLSRDMKVSRPRIYRALVRLGIEKRGYGSEYTDAEWGALTEELRRGIEIDGQVREGADKVAAAAQAKQRNTGGGAEVIAVGCEWDMPDADDIDVESGDSGATTQTISDIDTATLRERLACAKADYDFNRALLTAFQMETEAFYRAHGRTSVTANNGALIPIPSVTSTEKYIKLNIALSKLISALESDLDLEVDDREDGAYG
ncbi:MAG: hypothetical protein FWB91_06565 [Defluviitaleaceae bacterium]|nr:hypothetical protein [Defluviitaleaceae bacterium]